MSDWRLWPGLRGTPDRPWRLELSRGVYGKVHRARTDFRWIAASRGWTPVSPEVLNLGAEDESRDCPFHRAGGAWPCAGWFRSSRAIDAAGRRTPVEKQVAAWNRKEGVPPAAEAYFTLRATRDWSDSIWWNTFEDPRWNDSGYRLEIDPETIPCDPEELADLAEAGRIALREATTREALAQFYSELEAGRRGAVLELVRGAEPAASGLAALLLPLPSNRALSLILGVPSQSLPDREIRERWDGIGWHAMGRDVPRFNVSREHAEQGSRMAGWVWEGRFEGNRTVVAVPRVESPAPAAAAPLRSEPMVRGPVKLNPVIPNAAAAEARRRLEEFLGDDSRRWIDLARVPYQGPCLSEDETLILLYKLQEWKQQEIDQAGSDPLFDPNEKRRQLEYKLELCRSWLFALSASAESWRGDTPPQYVAPLTLAVRAPVELWARKTAEYTNEQVEKVGKESLRLALNHAQESSFDVFLTKWALERRRTRR